jgi:hypothetical protein
MIDKTKGGLGLNQQKLIDEYWCSAYNNTSLFREPWDRFSPEDRQQAHEDYEKEMAILTERKLNGEFDEELPVVPKSIQIVLELPKKKSWFWRSWF